MLLLQLLAQTNSGTNTNIWAIRLSPLIAFFIAYFFTVLELVTSKYPRTYSFIIKKISLHIYGVIYGVFALTIIFVLNLLLQSGSIKIEGLGLSNPLWKATLIGLSTKGFLKIKLFTVNVGTNPFPIGIDTIVQIFEPWLLEEISLNEYNAVRNYLENKVALYSHLSLENVKDKIKDNIPRNLKEKDKKVFKLDLSETTTAIDAMELYLATFGRETLERVFSDINPEM